MTAFVRSPFEEALIVELAVQRYAPEDAGFAASDLNQLADARALPGPVEHAGRCFVTEAREELADARNYLAWQHRLRGDVGSDAELTALERAIAALVVAWEQLAAVPQATP